MKKISKTAVIYEGAEISEGVIIHDYVVIYPNTIILPGAEIFEHCVIGRMPRSPGCTARKVSDDLPPAVIGEHTVLSVGCVVYAGTTIGHHTLLGDHCSIREECEIGNYCILSRNVSVNYHTKVGDRTKVMDNTHITGNAIIEEDVFISTLVATTNDNAMGKQGYDPQLVIGPWIKAGAVVGAAANILPRVIVGKDSVVGAGAVVTKDVPDGKVVMGIPARVVREVERTNKENQNEE